ncbi:MULTISPECIES: MerR family transcriptional regulator [Bacillus]|uniref:MerR family transcriptional regulator n=1 Tax=Bacillus TaxID=1386 RepID=UPI0002FEFF0A|nr:MULTISPECIES: MerR family transcriptional regulator [Bacillus]
MKPNKVKPYNLKEILFHFTIYNQTITLQFGGVHFGIERLKIGELADISNVSKRTIDHYTNLGLLKAERTTSNYRYYTHEAVHRIKMIKELKSQKLSLSEIKEIMQEQEQQDYDIDELQRKLQGLEKDVTEIVELIQAKKLNKDDVIKKQLSHESVALIQSLLILLM